VLNSIAAHGALRSAVFADPGAEADGAAAAGSTCAAGRYRCVASYPSPSRSLKLGRQNIHLFRLKNTRFDIIGGGMYFLFSVRASEASRPP
jgi:hypothetical protein